ncbi:GH35 family endo-1,4-beta-xylanase/beta-xylosidase [Rhodopirellula rubra]|uniref:Beta-xylanase n=1 Tax=Aporhodopirellula rubra TaxID=980271 RepID=A0A7W5DZJ5_9BACT|nr:endo-1,4-beta-xylanase [Aporhodopirellula rubra]MBB3207087.1 GH35 family endo-1,4-beta-xylanase/beta-xylosidase [Aporhodopirellula rubra]
MNKYQLIRLVCVCACVLANVAASAQPAKNPIIWADVPDVAVIRVDDCYYMSSTTMHMSPGLPIMKSQDLVSWQLVGYAYDTLAENDALTLKNGQDAYGAGSWASSLNYHNGKFYASTFSATTGKTHVFVTEDIENGPWREHSFSPALHDHSLFFDDDGRVYMVYGGGDLKLVELTADASAIKPGGVDQIIIPNASHVAGPNVGLAAEGSQLRKINGKYYVMNITWPRDGMRTQIIHRADQITGPYEGRVILQDRGVAQGGLIDSPQGDWYAMMFQDHGAVGRTPYLVPMKWRDGWPVLGDEGKLPDHLPIPINSDSVSAIVASDEFERKPDEPELPLQWQWNHNPDHEHWSVTDRPGWLRLTTGQTTTDLLHARNTLTQRTFGPVSTATTTIDVANMQDGDVTGLAVLQRKYGFVGVKAEGQSKKSIVMVSTESDSPVEHECIPLTQETVFFKVHCDFRDGEDKAYFFFSLDAKQWTKIGDPVQMVYTLPHFMGYRFALFNFATKNTGGSVDFNRFRVSGRQSTQHHSSLKKAVGGRFKIGVGTDFDVLRRSDDLALIKRNFQILTPENSMKPNVVQASEGEFDFANADALMDIAEANELEVAGHCLVWSRPGTTPAWFFRDGNQEASKDLVLSRLKTHIANVVGRYRGRIDMWDVVNEALADSDDEYLRDIEWSRITGEEFIVKAFQYAREADPDALLVYNDYNCTQPGKLKKLVRLVKSVKAQGGPIDAIGLQAHYEYGKIPYEGIEAALIAMRQIGVKVIFSELDMDVVTRARWYADDGVHRAELAASNPYPHHSPPDVLERQAEQYAKLFDVIEHYSDVVVRVTFWNLHDGQSWLNEWPWQRTNHPLLFDRDLNPKPAYHAVIETLIRSDSSPSHPSP